MPKIAPCLWFDGKAGQVLDFYTLMKMIKLDIQLLRQAYEQS